MLKGDLTTTPLAPLLIELAEQQSTGCLHISDAAGDEALIYFRTGLVYAVSVPGRRPQLGAKLVSSGALAPEALADALEAQRTELQGWRLGELLVHLGYVDQPVVEAFIREQVHDAIWDLMRWSEGRWRFRKNEKTREDVAPPTEVADLLHELRARGADWEAISAVVHGPTAVPVLSTRGGGAPETTLDPDAWSMLCKIDGERSVAELARDCGYTLFEAGHVLLTLVQAGLADIEEDVEVGGVALQAVPVDDDALYGATSVSSALVADAAEAQPPADGKDEDEDEDDSFAQLARLVTEVAATVLDDAPAAAPEALSQMPLRPAGDDQSFAASIARVSEALSDALGPATHGEDPFEVPAEFQARRAASQRPAAKPERTPEMERRERLRAAAAAELAAAHALAEALRQAATEEPSDEQERVADVVDLDEVRRESEGERAEAERVAAEEEAARVAAEEEAARIEAEEEAARLAAEEEAARLAAEEEAARLEAERAAAEEEAARVAAEEEAARIEAERVAAEEEAARIEAERVAAEEEAARLEAERVAAEEEAARLAAEEEAARLEAERVAAEEEEAARLAAEEEAARIEAERVAAEEEAARVAAEEEAARLEAERVAAEEEEAARVAAEEEAARLEAERVAAEEEAARLEAERVAAEEAERLAAELADAEEHAWAEYWHREAQEADRIAAEEEAARLEAERLEAERLAAEEEATRTAAEEQAARLEAERLARELAEEAERAAAEEEERLGAERAAQEAAEEAARRESARDHMASATALLVELSAASGGIQVEEPAAIVDEEIVEEEVVEEPVPVAATIGSPRAEMADTAALLRELSSLGLDEEPPSAPAPPPRTPSARPPAQVPDPRKKKRGLFGR